MAAARMPRPRARQHPGALGELSVTSSARAWWDGAMGSFRKQRAAAPRGFFACEAAGLRWLADARTVRVVQVLAADDHGLDLERIEPASPTIEAARRFGRDLAGLHDAGAPAF